MASSGLPTAPAQLPPHDDHGNPPGGEGSVCWAAAAAELGSRAVAIPDSAGSPRAVRSRLVAANSCCSAESWAQLEGSTMAGRPSWRRALAIAWTTAFTQPGVSTYVLPAQLLRKFGEGAMFTGGSAGGP